MHKAIVNPLNFTHLTFELAYVPSALETIRSELFVRLIERPDDVIQLDIRSMSSWKISWLVQRGRYSKMSSA